MDKFPETLVPGGETLEEMYKMHVLRKLREKVFECVVTGNPDNYVDLSAYSESKKVISEVRLELEALGWKTSLMYGETALFVFSENNKPKYW